MIVHAMRPASGRPPVSPADLLGRGYDTVYSPTARQLVAGKRVLVTGAGGSIGSELVRQLQGLGAGVVFRLDHDEAALHSLQMELEGNGLLNDDRIVLADIRDRGTLGRILQGIKPDIVYHAAAHKHLPLLERHPDEGVKTNVLGTSNVVSAAVAAGVSRFVNVSTDKAARPTSVLGSTKRLAEMVVSSYAGGGTRVASVRFGNVLGSRGSFLQSLSWQVAHARPVTITDEAVTRYFMTIPEAAGLVIEASVMAQGGETYVLDMGEPVRIVDLVHRYVTLSGSPEPEISYTGLRPGEKLHEELLDGAERCQVTAHPRIWCVRADQAVEPSFRERVKALAGLAESGNHRYLLAELQALLPEQHGTTVPAPRGHSSQTVEVA